MIRDIHYAEIDLQIPFHDVDMMEVAWHGHYSKYFEIACCALLDKIDFSFPRAAWECSSGSGALRREGRRI